MLLAHWTLSLFFAFLSETDASANTITIWVFLGSLPGFFWLTLANHLVFVFCFMLTYLFLQPNLLGNHSWASRMVASVLAYEVFIFSSLYPYEVGRVEVIIGSVLEKTVWRLKEGKFLLLGSPAHKSETQVFSLQVPPFCPIPPFHFLVHCYAAFSFLISGLA